MAGPRTKPETPTDASRWHFAVVAAEFNHHITGKLLDGALQCLAAHKAGRVDVHKVPGAFELPFAARVLAKTGRYHAIVCLGCVIRGETPHFEYVATHAARGISEASLETEVPVIFGVLTTEDEAQAEARAGGAHGNKGTDAALAAMEMLEFLEAVSPRDARAESEEPHPNPSRP